MLWRSDNWSRILQLLIFLLVIKVTLSITWAYKDYFPPNFSSGFLVGRREHFRGVYRIAFYSHIISGPITILLGMLLYSEQLRLRLPPMHRWFGRMQSVIVLLVVVPSGLCMARFAETGALAGIGFATLAMATALTVLIGWRSAVSRRFDDHRIWMTRCLLLLGSAIVLRVFGGVATVLRIDSPAAYPIAAWASWILPLIAFEYHRLRKAGSQRRETGAAVSDRRAN